MTGGDVDAGFVICRLEEIPDPGARAFRAGSGDWPLRGFIVRQGPHVRAYVNRCPHAGHPLDAAPGHFLLTDSLVQCASHGALFAIDSGECVAGPCVSRSLTAVAIRVVEGEVLLVDDPDALAARYA